MESAFGVGLAECMAAFSIDGVAGYPGRQTQELVVQAHGHWKACVAALATAAAAAPDEVSGDVIRNYASAWWMLDCRQHALPEFVPEAVFGSGGAGLRESIEVYAFDRHHAVA